MLEIKDLYAGYKKEWVLKKISLCVDKGEIVTLIGKNGCGKSTLLRSIVGATPKISGNILLDGVSITGSSPIALSRRISYLAQDKNIPDITVSRMVLNGRFPHLSYPRRYREIDFANAREAMERMGISALSERKLSELSGGMRQKVYIAMALCQGTDVILMDEPTTYLDVTQQFLLCDTVRELASESKAILLVLHDVLLALKISDKIALVDNGVIAFVGTPSEFIFSGLPEKIYGVSIHSVGNEYYYERI
jgi:iron complex transport system ATP-binding protein